MNDTIGRVTLGFFLSLALATTHLVAALAADDRHMVRDPEIAGPVIVGQGDWRTKIQQVFDPATRTLSRRLYTVWDAAPARDLDFVWAPDQPVSDKPGKINGAGLLIWRLKGKPSYDRSSAVAQYRGHFRNGRIEGRGVYFDNTGLYYEGEWKAGLMQGYGTLKLPGGDEYVGEFRDGRANGVGRLIDVTGEIYEGPFVNGLRHGRGTTTLPSGHTYSSNWTGGKETENSRQIRLAQAGGRLPSGADDIRIGITVDKALSSASREFEPGDLVYDVSNTQNGLVIRPDDKRLMSMWKGGGEIQLTPHEEGILEDEYGVLSKSMGQIVPLTLVLEVQNRSSVPVSTTGIYLDVGDSMTDMQPAIQLAVGPIGECSGYPNYRPKFRLENFGWGAAENAILGFGFSRLRSRRSQNSLSHSTNLGRITQRVTVDLEPIIKSAGVRVEFLARNAKAGVSCRKPKPLETCFNELKSSGMFGSLVDQVELIESFIVLTAAGRLEYSWRDASGAQRQAASPFAATFPLTFLNQENECGEGAAREAVTNVAQQLKLDTSNYRIPIAFRSTIPAGRTAQLTLPIKAGRSSEHNFKVVLQLSDGREIRSRPINLLYYVPSWYPRPRS